MASKHQADWTPTQKAKFLNFQQAADLAIPYYAKEVPALGNLTPQGLVDQLGTVKDAIKDLEKVEGILKGRLESQLEGKRTLRGDSHEMEIRSSERTALNQAKVKEYLTEQGILEEYMSTTQVNAMYVKRL